MLNHGVQFPPRRPLADDLAFLREQGIDAVFENWRGIYGPKGLRREQVAYWEEVFAKVAETDEWDQELKRNLSVATFMRQKEMTGFLQTNYRQLHEILSDLGYAK